MSKPAAKPAEKLSHRESSIAADISSCAQRTPLNRRVRSPDEKVIRVMSVRVAEAAITSLAVALGSQGLDKGDEIGGMRWGNLDGCREAVKAVRSQGAGRAISEDFEDPSLLCT